ncbi:TlpA disulfide reductase family protein [Danxiaibacter flavus]|uniref:TlpA disulfide reductase family protein n=1 Tax=Danxiaibacter flavus TaxID=3049108 RepID=A0ABV3ZB25_9BACT|nr:TlpA disulfide reductase family protein [Chitinophagaceae bacterium DXS]
MKKYFLGALLVASAAGISWKNKNETLPNGVWRASIERKDGQNITFNFETKDSAGKKVLYVINGNERLLVDNIKSANDSLLIQMPFFESGFVVKLQDDGNLAGKWVKRYGPRVQVLPFAAAYNKKERFTATAQPAYNVSGRWSTTFSGRSGETEAIGEFRQTGNKLTGTFLTTSGDYRYLEGVVSGDSLKLSGFDGGHAFLFTAAIKNNNEISGGKFYSGAVATEEWSATRNPSAELPDGYGLTKLKAGESKLDFTFKGIDEKNVSINDDRYKNKVVVIQILGSWCPNCMDETKFLSDYYKKNKSKGVEVIGLAYERTEDFKESQQALQSFKQRFKVDYPILVTGVAVSDTLRTEKTLPQLDKVSAFPTTIFIDKKGNVRKIHTGFNGPGTGDHYEIFKKEFDDLITSLLKEDR